MIILFTFIMRLTPNLFFLLIATLTVASLSGCISEKHETAKAASTEVVSAEVVSTEVVFVCEHGSVKSLIGATLFDKQAKERGLPYRAISRGLTPDESVPAKIADALLSDGAEVADYVPQKLSLTEAESATQIVAIGVDLSSFDQNDSLPIAAWNDIPPASVDYQASRASLDQHITSLLDQLEARNE